MNSNANFPTANLPSSKRIGKSQRVRHASLSLLQARRAGKCANHGIALHWLTLQICKHWRIAHALFLPAKVLAVV